MTKEIDEVKALQKFCSADCNLCNDLEGFDGLYTCMNISCEHNSHIFTDDHPICDDPCLK